MTQTSLQQLITESRRLRDHLLHVPGLDASTLTRALQPCDRADDVGQIDEETAARLGMAFQTAHEAASAEIDGYTLEAVLDGRSPYLRGSSRWASLGLTLFGLFLIAIAGSLTVWSNHSRSLLLRGEEFVDYEHFDTLTEMAALQNYIIRSGAASDASENGPLLIYQQNLSSLRAHYKDEQMLPLQMTLHLRDSQYFDEIVSRLRRGFCADPFSAATKPDATKMLGMQIVDLLLTCPRLPVSSTNGDQAEGKASGDDLYALDYDRFRFQEQILAEQWGLIMRAANRTEKKPYVESRLAVEDLMQSLRAQILSIDRLWLPFIYGALGSAIYCLWRVLHPSVAPLGFLHATMRTAFAGLAGLTLSMLIVPANLLPLAADASRPLVYMMAFIFGYSVEAFTAVLNSLNNIVMDKMSPRTKRLPPDRPV